MNLTNIRKAKGLVTPSGTRQIAIRFTPESFDAIAKAAVASQRSFAQQVLYYVGARDG